MLDTGYGLGRSFEDCRCALPKGRKYQMVKTQAESHNFFASFPSKSVNIYNSARMGQNFDEHQVPVNDEVCKMILQHSVRRYCPNVDTVGPTKEPTLPFSFYLRQQ